MNATDRHFPRRNLATAPGADKRPLPGTVTGPAAGPQPARAGAAMDSARRGRRDHAPRARGLRRAAGLKAPGAPFRASAMAAEPSGPPALPTAAGPEISVVIAHLNQPELLGRCLAALAAQRFDMRRAEVIVVDNGSRSLPEAITGRFPGVTLAREPVPGPGPARNRGVALARGEIIAFTDADCLPDPGWLAAIHARFAADPGLEILGGEVEIFPETPGDVTPAEAFQMLYAYRQELYITRQSFSVTANLVIRREVFDAVGPFAGLELAEDVDWGRRAAGAGHRIVYAPEVRVLHPARRSMAELRATWDRHVTHFYRREARGPFGRLRWALTIPLMALSPLAEIPAVLGARELTPAGRWRAFRGLAQIRLYRAFRMAAMLAGGRDGAARWNR